MEQYNLRNNRGYSRTHRKESDKVLELEMSDMQHLRNEEENQKEQEALDAMNNMSRKDQ